MKQPILDVQKMSQKMKPDPEIIIKQDELYARAWECDYETLFFDSYRAEPDYHNSPKIRVRHDLAKDETCIITWTTRESYPENFLQTDEFCDGTDTDQCMELDAEAISEQPNPSNANPRNTKNDLRHDPKPKCNDDYSY